MVICLFFSWVFRVGLVSRFMVISFCLFLVVSRFVGFRWFSGLVDCGRLVVICLFFDLGG